MPEELYNEVKDEIPKHIGVYTRYGSIKRATRQALGTDETVLKDSLLRSLYRDAEKMYKSENPTIYESLKRQIKQEKQMTDHYRNLYLELMQIGRRKYGNRWDRD